MEPTHDSRTLRRPRWRRALRVAAVSLELALAGVVLLVVTVILLAPLRTAALRAGMRLADDALPGTLSVESTDWPRLNRVALAGVVWVDPPDTLLWLGAVELEPSWRSLLRREYDVRALRIEGLRADVPAIAARFAKAPGDTLPTDDRPFVPDDLPPFVVDELRVVGARLRISPNLELVVPRLRLAADLRGDGGSRTMVLSGLVHSPARPEIGAALRLEASLGDSLVVRLAPIHLDDPARLPDPDALLLGGRLAATLDDLLTISGDDPWPRLSLQGLRVVGSLGELDLAAELHGHEPGEVRGRLRLEPPPVWLVDQALAAASDTLAAELRPLLTERWPREAPPSLSWDGQFTPPSATGGSWPVQAAFTGAFVLPGPSHVSPLLPSQLRVDDLGALRGRLAARYASAGDSMRMHVDLDLDETAWLQTGRLRADTDGRGWVSVDTLVLALPGLALDVHGRLDRERVDAAGTIDIASALLARWDDPTFAGIEGRFHVGLTADGLRAHPRLHADLDGHANARGLSLPAVAARASLADNHLVLALDAPAGFTYGATALDSLRLSADVTAYDGLQRFVGEATATGGGRHGQVAVPRADLHATLDGRHAVVTGFLPAGLTFRDARLDSARVDLDVTARDESLQPREGRLALTAAGRRGELVVPRLDLQASLDGHHGLMTATLPAGLTYGDAVVDSAHADLDVTAREETLQPRAGRLRLTAAGRRGDLVVPRLDVAGDLVDSSVVLGVELPDGLVAGQTRLDELWCRFDGSFGDSLRHFAGRLTAAGDGAGTRLQLASDVDLQRRDGPPAIRAHVDSLEVQQRGRGVVLQRPW